MLCRQSPQATTSLRSWQKKQQRLQQRQQQPLRRDWDRDYRCQFIAAVVLGAIGAAVSCVGTGLIVYGLPTADRLQRETGSLTEQEAVAIKVSLMLYGRLGGLLLGIGLFLLIVLAVIGTDYRQHRLSRRRPSEDARTAGNRRLYADILRGLRLLWQDGDEAENDGNRPSSGSSSRRASTRSGRLPDVDAAEDEVPVPQRRQQQQNRRANSLRLSEPMGRKLNGDAAAWQQQPGLLRPTWRANEAFDSSDEIAAFRRLSNSVQSMRRTASRAANGAASLQQLFNVEAEFVRFAGADWQQKGHQHANSHDLELSDLVDNDFEASFGTATAASGSAQTGHPDSTKQKAATDTASKGLADIERDGAPEF